MTRKYNLPKYICFDVRTSLCRKKPIYDVTLVSDDDKAHSTKTLTVYDAVMEVVKNRITYKNWSSEDVAEYVKSYNFTMENQYSLQDACDTAGVKYEDVMSGQYMKDRYNKSKINPVEKENTPTKELTNKEEVSVPSKIDRKEYLEYLKKNPQWFNMANFPEYQIYSEPYLFTNEYGKTCYTYRIRNLITGKEYKPTTKSNSLYFKVEGVYKAVYKLAADTFLHNPNKKYDNTLVATEVHHLNGDHDDNRLENLEHVTKEEHALFHKKMNKNKKREFLSFKDIVEIKARSEAGKSLYKISEELGIPFHRVKAAVEKTEEQINRILKREAKQLSK